MSEPKTKAANLPTLPADLPENWVYAQTISPNGTEAGLTPQHGYNYLMQQVNQAQALLNQVTAILQEQGAEMATKDYVTEQANLKVSKAGDTMTGPLLLPGNPTANLQAAPKQYVDTAVQPKANQADLNAHVNNKSNPHSVTAAQAGALGKTETAAAATKLATSRTIRTNLASTSSSSFNGTANITPGVTGVLPVANGGTGSSTEKYLPLAGGTMDGDILTSGTIKSTGVSKSAVIYIGSEATSSTVAGKTGLLLTDTGTANPFPTEAWIRGVMSPAQNNDAATKGYVDTAINGRVPTSRTVNGKALSSNISLTASDVSALPTSGGTITGNLTLKGSGNYGNKINFGDGDYVYLQEPTDDDLAIRAKRIFARTISCRDDLKKLGQEDLQDYIFPQFGIYVGNGQSTNNIAIFTNRSASKPRAILIEGIGSVSSNKVSVSGYTGRRQGNYFTSSGTPILGGLFVAGIKYTNSNGQSVEFVDGWLKLTNIAGEYLNVNGRYYAYVVF